jgi:hypothetical protein
MGIPTVGVSDNPSSMELALDGRLGNPLLTVMGEEE